MSTPFSSLLISNPPPPLLRSLCSLQVTNPDFPDSRCALLKNATELIIEPNPRSKLPSSFPPSKPLRLLPTESDARREISHWEDVWSKQYPNTLSQGESLVARSSLGMLCFRSL